MKRHPVFFISTKVGALAAVGVLFLGLVAGTSHAQVTQSMLDNAAKDSKNWLLYGGNYENTRYTRAKQINTGNVKNLHVKYVFQTGVVASFENTPIVVNGKMFVSSPWNHLFAVDAATGKELWHYTHKLSIKDNFC